MTDERTVLVADDEEVVLEILTTLLTREGYTVRTASTGEEGLEMARGESLDAAIVDVMMPGQGGMATLDALQKLDRELPVIMLTAYGSVESAKTAIKAGAFDYLTKPFKHDEVLKVLRNAVEQRRLIIENRALRQNLQAQSYDFDDIVGRSPRLRQAVSYTHLTLPTICSV